MNLKAIGISIVLLFLYIVIVSYFIKHNSFEQEKQCNPVTPIPTPIDKKQVKDIFDGNHLGCYDTSNTLLHSSRIRNYLSETVNKYRSGEIIKLDQHNSVVMRGSFDKQVKDLAVIFEKYLDEYYQLKIRGDYENNWHNSL